MDQFGSGLQVMAVTSKQQVSDEKGDFGRSESQSQKQHQPQRRRTRVSDPHSPDSADVFSHHGLSWFAVEGFAELGHVRDYAVGTILFRGMWIDGRAQALVFFALVRTPALAVADEEALVRGQVVDRIELLILCVLFPCKVSEQRAAQVG
jgi:hypothetical protein